jgi:hypothetical protein
MSIFNVFKHGWKILSILRNSEVPNKYELSKQELIFLGLSIGYLFTTIFTKITL